MIKKYKEKLTSQLVKHAGGRPSKMTELILGKLEAAFAYDMTDEEACHYAGIHPSTLYDYKKKNPEFSERAQALKQWPIMLAKITLVNSLTTRRVKKLDKRGNLVEVDIPGNARIAMWYLERTCPEEYSLTRINNRYQNERERASYEENQAHTDKVAEMLQKILMEPNEDEKSNSNFS